MSLEIIIPDINGSIEAGLAVGTDPSLSDDKKIPIVEAATTQTASRVAAKWAYFTFRDSPDAIRRAYVSAAVICVQAGLCRRIGAIPDGDWRTFNSEAAIGIQGAESMTAADSNRISSMITKDDMQKALTLIIATKATWWLTNHHTGQGEPIGFTKKVLTAQYGAHLSAEIVTMAHTIGHWTSTINILTIAEVQSLRRVSDAVPTPNVTVVLTSDSKMRFTSLPAGTHRLVVAYEAAKRLVKSPAIRMCPSAQDFASLPDTRNRLIAEPSRYHIGAQYLTGVARSDYSDMFYESYLGRLGTYVRRMFAKSTLAASPQLHNNDHPMTQNLQTVVFVSNMQVFRNC